MGWTREGNEQGWVFKKILIIYLAALDLSCDEGSLAGFCLIVA